MLPFEIAMPSPIWMPTPLSCLRLGLFAPPGEQQARRQRRDGLTSKRPMLELSVGWLGTLRMSDTLRAARLERLPWTTWGEGKRQHRGPEHTLEVRVLGQAGLGAKEGREGV